MSLMKYSVDDVTYLGEAMSNVAWEVMTTALRHLALCSGIYGEIPEDSIEAEWRC